MSGRRAASAGEVPPVVRSIGQQVATLGVIGRAPLAPGTVASAVGLGLCLPLLQLGWVVHLAAAGFLAVVAVIACHRAAEELGHPDPSPVVIDEVLGMWCAALMVPMRAYDLCAVFLLFRMFDIVKPAPISRLERLPGGFGIVADDIAAGLLARATWWLLKVNFDFV